MKIIRFHAPDINLVTQWSAIAQFRNLCYLLDARERQLRSLRCFLIHLRIFHLGMLHACFSCSEQSVTSGVSSTLPLSSDENSVYIYCKGRDSPSFARLSMTYLPFPFSLDWIDPNWSWTWLSYKWGANRFRFLTSWKMSISELTSLQKTLNVAIDTFKAELAAQNLTEPSLNTSKPHPIDEITYLPTPAMYEARRVALASLVCFVLLSLSVYWLIPL